MNEEITEALRNLPQFNPPESMWQNIRGRITGEKRRVQWWVPTTLAASLMAAILVALNLVYLKNQQAQMESLNDLINEVSITEFNVLNTPRISREESGAQFFISEYLNTIERHLSRPEDLDIRHQRKLLERKHVLLKNYQLLQVQQDAKLKRAYYVL